MNKTDRDYLLKLMSLDDEQWDMWAAAQSRSNLDHVLTLIKIARTEETITTMEIEEQIQNERGLDCTEALCVIENIKQSI
jgi:hypothetical protein